MPITPKFKSSYICKKLRISLSFRNLHIPSSNRIFKVNSISPCYLTISPLFHIPLPPLLLLNLSQ